MAVGDCERALAAAAALDGITLVPHRQGWLNQRGHFGLPAEARDVFGPLDGIFTALGGDAAEQQRKRTTTLPNDFLHVPSGALVEVDELQHFTTYRRITLALYPDEIPLGFDRTHYQTLCDEHASRADRYRAAKAAIGFGAGGRQRQRAYFDALRDLAAPAMGHPFVVRVDAADGDGVAAWRRSRERVIALLGGAS